MAKPIEVVYDEVKQYFGLVPDWIKTMPEAGLSGFWSLMRDFELAETAIPNKYKELIGIAVSGATRCRYCALFHTEGARLNGATDDEIAEAGFMGALTMLGSTFLNAEQIDYERFANETKQVVEHVRKEQKAGKRAAAAPEAQAE